MLSSGSLLDNRYRLDDRIATGGMGDVWRGTDVVLGRTVAVKVLRTAMLTDPEFAARFYGEARMMAAFRHPGVVEVYDYSAGDADDEDSCAYLVMAFVDGEPLSARLKEQGRLGVSETMSIVAQAADALHAAHENGTVHRDVKPGNLIVKPNGTVILVDFGVARSAAVTSVTGLNAIVGTALYMAPEQVAKGNVSPATDIYALGAVAYHCIAGVPPFDGDNALQVALRHLEDDPEPLPESLAPPAVRELISRAMAKNPADRFQSAAEFSEAALAAAGALDWRSQTGASMTRTALVRPSTTGTSLSSPGSTGARIGGVYTTGARLDPRTSMHGQPAAPVPTQSMHGQPMYGQSMTGTALTRPMSPAGPRTGPPAQRNLLEAAPPRPAAPARGRQSNSQLAVLITVIALFLLAGGLGVAIWLSSSSNADERQTPGVQTVPSETVTTETTEDSEPEQTQTFEAPEQPNNPAPPTTRPRPNRTSSPPQSKPTSSPPQSKPTSSPATNPTTGTTPTPPENEPDPTDTDTAPPTDDDTGGPGLGGGGLLGGGGGN
ncbi:serine/threonine-protein kinase [Actinoplanes sp. N902-109]|uniref:serine/threonine-protein kinase n=1 Tax=Actinoplanes sp. (strain N902-109) TaxID=649831 RepID=UPI0003294E42|nr:serine/threonine-protein kinase [Actinoplanes sp. N902-109]AGL15251.1 serine/threonine protein kinase [Actinoplanes sp. N902-109]